MGQTKKLELQISRVWNFIGKLVKKNEANLLKYDLIMGISRGGLIPAVYLSKALNKPLLTVRSENGEVKFNTRSVSEKTILLVDDIVKSGKNMKMFLDELKKYAKEVDTFSIYSYQEADFRPTYSIRTTKEVRLPWTD